MFDKARLKMAKALIGKKSISVPNIAFSDTSRLLLNGKPFYTNLDNFDALADEYRHNPILSTVINLKADYSANALIKVRNIKNGEIYDDKMFRESKSLNPIVKKMFKLKNNPNPLQSTKEFLSVNSIFKDVFGNSFIYGNSPSKEITIEDVMFLWNVYPQYIKPVPTGKYFDQTSILGINKNWKFKKGQYAKEFSVYEILHRKEPNLRLSTDEDLVLGESRQVSLQWPLSNIRIAYESRNVIARHRGAKVILTSGISDANGTMPMTPEEKDDVEKMLKQKYGLMEEQSQYLLSEHPLNVHQIDQDVRKLGLLNEIQSDMIIVSERYGVSKTLTEISVKGATFENQDAAELRMYQNTTIPEEIDRWSDITNWLKCPDFGYEYIVSFDHIPTLQENEKEKSEIYKNKSGYLKEMFFSGAITYNVWLQGVGMPTFDDGNRTILQMTTEEIEKIKGNYSINNSLDTPNSD